MNEHASALAKLRAKKLTPERRKEIAIKASKAAAEKRKKIKAQKLSTATIDSTLR